MKRKKHIPVKQHDRRPPGPRSAPMPGQTDFSPAQEQAMRKGMRAQNEGGVRGSIRPRQGDVDNANGTEEALGDI